MANLLKQALSISADLRARHLGERVTYVRGQSSVTLSAEIGRRPYNRDDGQGGIVAVESIDFLLRPADLVLDGIAVRPQRGDRIVVGDRTHEIAFPDGRNCYQEINGGTRLRVHTALVENREDQ